MDAALEASANKASASKASVVGLAVPKAFFKTRQKTIQITHFDTF